MPGYPQAVPLFIHIYIGDIKLSTFCGKLVDNLWDNLCITFFYTLKTCYFQGFNMFITYFTFYTTFTNLSFYVNLMKKRFLLIYYFCRNILLRKFRRYCSAASREISRRK